VGRSTGKVWVDLDIDGLDQFAKLNSLLDDAKREFLDDVAHEGEQAVKVLAPGGPTGKAGRAVKGKVHGGNRLTVGSSGFKGARALERGAFIAPKASKALKFASGFVTKKPVRLKAHRYHERGWARVPSIAKKAFRERFHHLHRRG
jgi:hypothetical protein